MTVDVAPLDWGEWYRFALEVLCLAPADAAEYANLRLIEDENRALPPSGARTRRADPTDA